MVGCEGALVLGWNTHVIVTVLRISKALVNGRVISVLGL